MPPASRPGPSPRRPPSRWGGPALLHPRRPRGQGWGCPTDVVVPPPAARARCGPRGKSRLDVASQGPRRSLESPLLTVAPGAPAGPTRPDSTRGSHSVQQMPLFIFMCFQKSERSETQLRYKIQHKMRFIPIFPQKAKSFSEIALPKLIGRSYFPPLPTMASAPGTSPRGAWEVGTTLALRMTGGNRTPWPPGLTN